jgi:hypothetical protein
VLVALAAMGLLRFSLCGDLVVSRMLCHPLFSFKRTPVLSACGRKRTKFWTTRLNSFTTEQADKAPDHAHFR